VKKAMSKLQAVLQQTIPAGVYRFPSRATIATLEAEAAERGWRLFHLDGTTIHDKATFLAATKDAFAMPSYVASNWDAFEEAINDLAWAPAAGYAVLYDDAAALDESNEAVLTTALDIFETAAKNWQAHGKPFYVLLRRAGQIESTVAAWPEDV
jgi:hypothetical protein